MNAAGHRHHVRNTKNIDAAELAKDNRDRQVQRDHRSETECHRRGQQSERGLNGCREIHAVRIIQKIRLVQVGDRDDA